MHATVRAAPLAAIPDKGGTVEGLRLLSGDLVVRIGCGGASVQVWVRDAPRLPDDGGLSVMYDFWSSAGLPAPGNGRIRWNRTGPPPFRPGGSPAGRAARDVRCLEGGQGVPKAEVLRNGKVAAAVDIR